MKMTDEEQKGRIDRISERVGKIRERVTKLSERVRRVQTVLESLTDEERDRLSKVWREQTGGQDVETMDRLRRIKQIRKLAVLDQKLKELGWAETSISERKVRLSEMSETRRREFAEDCAAPDLEDQGEHVDRLLDAMNEELWGKT